MPEKPAIERDPAHGAPGTTTAGHRSSRWVRLLTSGLILSAMFALGAAAGIMMTQGSHDRGRIPSADSVDVGFSQDMSTHHENAVQMAVWTREHTTDPEVRQLAYDIESGQTSQIGQMQGWLILWGAPAQSSEGYMRWMPTTHQMTSGPRMGGGMPQMPGMATAADLAGLRTAGGAGADVLFLQLMLRHHEGGAEMLRYAAERADRVPVRNLAGQMLVAQTAESALMRRMLAERGSAPLSS